MQAPQGSQRPMQRRSPAPDAGLPSTPRPSTSSGNMASASLLDSQAPRNSSGSAKSPPQRRQNQPQQQLSQIEKSVTHLLIATKQLLETLTQWSRHNATEAEVSDVYVRLGYEFNIACRAFTAIGVETADLGPVPDLLRAILEDTLSQDASRASLDRYLPRIRDIIINLLHGLKRKQQKLRQRGMREGSSSSSNGIGMRQGSIGSIGSGEGGLGQMLDETQAQHSNHQHQARRQGSGASSFDDEKGLPPRGSSAASRRVSPVRQDSMPPSGPGGRTSSNRGISQPAHQSTNSSSGNAMQNVPTLAPYQQQEQIPAISEPLSDSVASFPPPPLPPKQQDALAALQRGGDLERRASKRFSAYQISKHLGASPNGVPMLPPSQNSPIPNRGRDVRESMNAVRTRGSFLHNRQRSTNRFAAETSPNRAATVSERISEEGLSNGPSFQPPPENEPEGSPIPKTPEDKLRSSYLDVGISEDPGVETAVHKSAADSVGDAAAFNAEAEDRVKNVRTQLRTEDVARQISQTSQDDTRLNAPSTSAQPPPFVPEHSPMPGKELTLFLQYKSKIKKFILPDGYNDLSLARLQLAFIEKFAWNTHNNGNDLPEIYIQDPVSGVRHELEDLEDVKDRSVLVLNVEVLDEVKRHIDDGIGGLRRVVEGVRTVIDDQQSTIQRVSDRQQETAKEIARLAAGPPPSSTRSSTIGVPLSNGLRQSTASVDSAGQLNEIQSLRRDLAVVRQTYSSFVSDIETSMSSIRSKASSVKTTAISAVIPTLEGETGRAYVNVGKKTLGEDSEKIVNRVDDLQDLVEDLRKDVVSRGVRPLPRQLETVSKDISGATTELKKMQEYLKREKPIWTKIWEKELELVCNDRDLLTMQEELAADLEDDLEKLTQTFALVEQATKQQNLQNPQMRSTSQNLRSLNSIDNQDIDPIKARDGVLGEVKALQPNHETRLEAIERAERARQKELESRRGGEFQKELGSFVEEGRLKKSGGVEEAERLRKAKDERIRKEVWERMNARAAAAAEREQEAANQAAAGVDEALQVPAAADDDGGSDTTPDAEFVEAAEHSEEGPNGVAGEDGVNEAATSAE
ncbi:MAG: hypothetical protein M1819_002020 [Sarea resinae]|nr:MAG: hypothetical protein M1819_002020 [Sarea resinae]